MKTILFISLFVLLFSTSCASIQKINAEYHSSANYILRDPTEAAKVLGKPNEVSTFNGRYMTYTYYCVNGKYIVLDWIKYGDSYTLENMYTSNGICNN